jgi:hypothetical protein
MIAIHHHHPFKSSAASRQAVLGAATLPWALEVTARRAFSEKLGGKVEIHGENYEKW